MKIDPKCDEALDTAKFNFIRDSNLIFYSTLALSLKHSFSDQIPTAQVNNKLEVKYNPDFFMGCSPEERIGLIAHEAMHVAYLHIDKDRLNGRDPSLWNMAGDYVINLQLIEAGIKLPKGGLYDTRFKEMSTEDVYNILVKEDVKPDPNVCDVSFNDGDEETSGDSNTIASIVLQQQIEDILIRAVTVAKQSGKPGKIPGDIEIFLDKLLNPKLPWQTILRKWMNVYRKDDYSMRKPNKKYLPNFYIPSLWSEGMGDAAIFTDTSGSVSDQDFNNAVSEAHYLIKQLKPTKVFFGQFDTSIKSINIVKKAEDLAKLKFVGRGGTDVTDVLNWANKNKPKFIIIFSDGEFHIPNIKMNTEVLWLIYDNPQFTAPYGKVIHYQNITQ